MKKFRILICTLSLLLFSQVSLAKTAVNPVEASAGGEAQGAPQFKDCQDAWANITRYCTMSPEYQQREAQAGIFQRVLGDGQQQAGAAGQHEESAATAKRGLASWKQIVSTCNQAVTQCNDVCNRLHAESANRRPTPDTVGIENAQKGLNQCKNEMQTVQARAAAANAMFAEMLKTALEALKVLKGLGGGKSSASLTNPDDPCEKYEGILVGGECGDKASSTASRAQASLTGVNPGDVDALNGDGLLQTASQGEAGGQSTGNQSKGSGFNAASAGGLGGFGGSGGFGSGTDGAGAGSGDELNADIHKGYMGADGAAAGGGFSGGGSASRSSAPFGRAGSGASSRSALASQAQKLSKKFTGDSKRGLASAGGTNGPFQDNWSVIKKAYKKNSKTMYHQK